ncbi:MAG: alpha/beta hydrolase family protein [Nitriliruptoraceae bacterium]
MTTEEFVFTATDGVELAGSLELPDQGERPSPAALLLVGSGQVDRDSDHLKLPLGVTRELASALAGVGIASLRFDKRGVGASGGDHLATTFDDARRDAAAALAALRGHPAIDPKRVLVVGHSEGAIHAISLAAADASLAGLGILSGPAVTGEATLRWQAARILPTLPALVRFLVRVLRQTPERAQAKLFAKVRATDEVVLRVQGRRLNAGWLRGFLDHDPSVELAQVRVPVFALTGDRDLQVDPDDLERMRAIVTEAPLVTHRPPQVNHVLRTTDGVGAPSEYRRQVRAGQPLDPGVLDALTTWAAARTAVHA